MLFKGLCDVSRLGMHKYILVQTSCGNFVVIIQCYFFSKNAIDWKTQKSWHIPSICLVYACHIPLPSLTRHASWENNHHVCKDSLCVLEALMDAIYPLDGIETWVLLENKLVSYAIYMTGIWTDRSYDMEIPDIIWKV